jgi:hypothetical protein
MPHMQDPGAVPNPEAEMTCHMNCDCTDCLQPDSAGVFQPPPHCEEAQGSDAEPQNEADNQGPVVQTACAPGDKCCVCEQPCDKMPEDESSDGGEKSECYMMCQPDCRSDDPAVSSAQEETDRGFRGLA